MPFRIPSHTDNWVVQTNIKSWNAGFTKSKELELGPNFGVDTFLLNDIHMFISELEQKGYDPENDIEEEKTEDEPARDYKIEIVDVGEQIRREHLLFQLSAYPDKTELNIKKLVAQNKYLTAYALLNEDLDYDCFIDIY